MSKLTALEALDAAMKNDPEFKKISDEMHEAYVNMLRGDTPKDWVYRSDYSTHGAIEQMFEILGEENYKLAAGHTRYNKDEGILPTSVRRFSVFISPRGIEILKDFKAKHVVQ